MPTKEEHLETALHNEQLAEVLAASKFTDWAVTVYFYTALHYAHAVLAIYGQHPQSHEATAPLVRSNQVLKRIWKEYRCLQVASRNARYYAAKISPQHLHDVQIAFGTIKGYIRAELGIQ